MSWTAQVRLRLVDGQSFAGDGEGDSDAEALDAAMDRLEDAIPDEAGAVLQEKENVTRLVIVLTQAADRG